MNLRISLVVSISILFVWSYRTTLYIGRDKKYTLPGYENEKKKKKTRFIKWTIEAFVVRPLSNTQCHSIGMEI